MLLIIVRHGIAEDRKTFKLKDKDDHHRPLTKSGKKKFQVIAKKLKALIGPIDKIVSSPLVRAEQTAQILKDEYPKAKVLLSESLTPTAQPKDFAQWCQQHVKKGTKSLVIVGHEPHLGLLASWLLSGSQQSHIKIKKGGCLAIEINHPLGPKKGVLQWAMTPKNFLMI